jgi:hypothetical protein
MAVIKQLKRVNSVKTCSRRWAAAHRRLSGMGLFKSGANLQEGN